MQVRLDKDVRVHQDRVDGAEQHAEHVVVCCADLACFAHGGRRAVGIGSALGFVRRSRRMSSMTLLPTKRIKYGTS